MFNTQLSGPDEREFIALLNQIGRRGDLQDYDLRGAYQAGLLTPDGVKGHLPDTFKKPNHPTFSNESIYHGEQFPGGQWAQGPNGKWTFQASPFNLDMNSAPTLQDYFRTREPDSLLQLPPMQNNTPPPMIGVRG